MTTNLREVSLRWEGEGSVMKGETGGGAPVLLDGDSRDGPAPTEALLAALAGCMAVDIQAILAKGRVPLTSLEVSAMGERAPDPPQRYTSIRLLFRLEGPGEEDEGKILRAIQLSEDKYCSVHHTLRPDLPIRTEFERV